MYIISEMPCEYKDRRIYGKLYMPEDRNGRLPAVIMSHGYNSSHTDLEDMARGIADSGYAVYVYDFCGGSVRSKSSGSSLEMSIATETDDLKAVISMICGLDGIDESKLFLYGESQGGYVSALTAAELGNTVRGIMLLYPAFCIRDDWEKISRGNPKTIDFMGMTLSDKFYKELPDCIIAQRLGECSFPAIFFHGTEDSVVNISYSRRAEEIMENAELVEYEGEGHGFSDQSRQDVLKRMKHFIERNM